MSEGWIGVDLDGTLAFYAGWANGEIGEPIDAMVARVRRWLRAGQQVRIVTARVGPINPEFAREQVLKIQDWCMEHIGRRLEVQAHKDFAMIELWDDRAVQLVPNTGERVDGKD